MATVGNESSPYFIHALSPLRVGAGTGVGFIDLPITREAATNLPFVPGSAVKGVFADHHNASANRRADDATKNEQERVDAYLRRLAFGAAGDTVANAGAIVFTDARLLCLPVRSIYGTFAWCSSPFVLERFRRDLFDVDPAVVSGWTAPLGPGDFATALVADTNLSVLTDESSRVYFEDVDFTAVGDSNASLWADALARAIFTDTSWQRLFRERFAVVHDDVFSFLADHATQLDARVSLDEQSKTVAAGPWYEESLPAESILAGLCWCGPIFGRDPAFENGVGATALGNIGLEPTPTPDQFRTVLWNQFLKSKPSGHRLQLGGHASIGRGQVRTLVPDNTWLGKVEREPCPSS